MFRFESPIYLYLILLVPLFAALHYVMASVRQRRLRKFGDIDLVRSLMPMYSRTRLEVKFWLSMAALVLSCILLARPQYGHKTETENREGIEAIICLDISRSMLAQDVAPSRLEKAKMMVSNLVDKMDNDKIGLIIFAGDAFTQLPITSDYVSAKMFLDGISPDLIKVQGTDIAHALTIAMRSFTPDEQSSKAIIVITDGENHEGGAEEAARKAADMGINIFVLGVGTPAGSPVPAYPGANDFITDETGQVVVSKLNDAMCRDIASAGRGAYIYVDNSSSAQKQLAEHLDKLGKTTLESIVYNEFDEQFQTVALLLFIILLLDVCINEARNPRLDKIKLFRSRTMAVVLMMLAPALANAQSEHDHLRHGNRCYRDSDYVKAEVYYHKAIDANPRSAIGYYNLACAQLRQHKAKEAMQSFETSAKMDTVPQRMARTYHNMGVILQSQKQFAEAIKCYKNSLIRNPHDDETRYNLVLCQRQLKDDQQDQQNQDQQNQDQQQNQQQDQQQDQQQQDQQQQEQKENQMSRENAEQMLEAAMQDEKQTQEKMQKRQAQPQKRRLQKEW